MDKRLKTFVINQLRRISLKWYARNIVIKKAFIRVEGNKHVIRCNRCRGEFYRKEIEVDHINPVVDVISSNYTIDEFCERLFVPLEGLQILCINCHKTKSAIENGVRLERETNNLTNEQAYSMLKSLLIEKGYVIYEKKEESPDDIKVKPKRKTTKRVKSDVDAVKKSSSKRFKSRSSISRNRLGRNNSKRGNGKITQKHSKKLSK